MAKRGKSPKKPREIPDSVFKRQARRIDDLTSQWMQKWPHGVNPKKMLDRTYGPLVRAYMNGVRTPELLSGMEKMEAELTIPGLCEVTHGDDARSSVPTTPTYSTRVGG